MEGETEGGRRGHGGTEGGRDDILTCCVIYIQTKHSYFHIIPHVAGVEE